MVFLFILTLVLGDQELHIIEASSNKRLCNEKKKQKQLLD